MREVDGLPGRRSGASAALLVGLATEHGMPAHHCLRGTGLTHAALLDPEAAITPAQELRIVRNLVEDLGHVPGLGLEAGRRYRATTFGPLGLAALSSRTLGDAVALSLRYFDLTYAFSPFRPVPIGNALRTVIDDRTVRHRFGEDVARFLAERDVAAVVTFLRDLLGDGRGLDHVSFGHPEPPTGADRYAQVLGVRPSFGGGRTFGVISARRLGSPLPHADAHTAELGRRQCERLLASLPNRPGPRIRRGPDPDLPLADRVRHALARRLERGKGLATQTRIAAELHLSERSLRRLLAAEGVRYSTLVDETTAEAARRLLSDGHTVESTAAALGYSGSSSFTHAFKRWTGTSPGRFRSGLPNV